MRLKPSETGKVANKVSIMSKHFKASNPSNPILIRKDQINEQRQTLKVQVGLKKNRGETMNVEHITYTAKRFTYNTRK